MAMVLDAFASYVGHLLTQVAADELVTMLGVTGEIDKMDEKLRDLKNFLADADRRTITDESVREWVGQLKRAMYEATDILDLCQLKAMERGSSSMDAGCFNPLLFCMRNPFHAREIGTRIKALNMRLDNIKQRSAAFSFISLGYYEDRHNSKMYPSNHGGYSRETWPDLDRTGVVGEKIEEDTRALVAQITQTGQEVNNNIMVVAIVGVGGIGKTTLAQKVFNDEAIQAEFSKKIWLSVNQNFNEVELLTRAIIEAGEQPAGNAKAALHQTLKDAVTGHKTFLVMDDVWNNVALEGVLKIPLINAIASGSRVLITTRDEGVAREMRATWPYHHVDTLAPDDSWSLLKKQVLSSEIDEDHIDTLKDIGLKIIQKCGGLPLAIKVMGGLLHMRGDLRRDWQQVSDDAKWSIAEMPHELNSAVYLSYEDMPSYLKQCFLYYSLLPKSRNFFMDQVIAMWISEGFIHGNSRDLEELGENYYKQLISRNLIEPDKLYINHPFCSMHDVVRSFAQYMTKDESLIAHVADNDILTKLSSHKFLRLSIETGQSGELDWKSLQEQQSVRTLISNIRIKMKPGDSLVTFSSLRTLHMESADVAAMLESLHQLKHLRYLALLHSDISALPVNIGKMKLLQYLDLRGCKNLVNLPGSIVKLAQLRVLFLADVSMIPRGFCSLTNMRKLAGFRAHMDGKWCSLDELGPLSQLKVLKLRNLENVSASSFASNAKLGEKMHLTKLFLDCTSRLGHDGLVKEKEGVSEEEQQQVENVFGELCPPHSIENITIDGYFGQQLPSWMMSKSLVPFDNLKILFLSDLAYCTQLPNGLCQLPCLQFLQVSRAPCIRRVGTGFLQEIAAPFPRLNKMCLTGMVEWEEWEWEWEEQVKAMPRLEELRLKDCKLRRVPPGLASNARALKKLMLGDVQNLSYLENFPSVIELAVIASPDLERITDLPSLQKLTIINCSKLKVLDSIPALERLVLEDYAMEKLPEYMRDTKSRHLQLHCRVWLLAQLAAGQSGTEWDKFSHIEHVKAYAPDGSDRRKWYMVYTKRDNFKLDSNISSSTVFQETLSSPMEGTHGFESVYEMRRSTFTYVCSLVRIPIFEDMMARDHTFIDGRVMSLQDRVAVALRMLKASDAQDIIGSSVGVDKSTASLLTQRFVDAMCERALHHMNWPGSDKMEKIKRKFDNIHGLPNCCGVVYTAHIKFGSEDHDHEENDGMLMQVVVDPDMRFTNSWFGSSGSMNQSSVLHDSWLFKSSENGACLNGSKLKLSDGSDAGEYIIGDAGYPLRPWLLTPYQLESDLSLSLNRRVHSAATTVAQKAQARLLDTWKCLQGEGWRPNNQREMLMTTQACCLLHNILIGIPSYQQESYVQQVCQIAHEDAVRMRDALSQHMIKSGETLPSSMVDAQITKVGRRTFTYLCSLMRDQTFVEGRVLSLQDRVAIALRVLGSGEPLVTVGSSLGVKESTVLLVTQGFVEAMRERAMHHLRWPGSAKMEKIKSKFDKIHGLPNCCGVVHTAHIKFGSQNSDHDVSDGVLFQALVDPDMRFTNIWMVSSVGMNKLSLFHSSPLFNECKNGAWLNGSKLQLPADGSDVGEYIIGDMGYPLLPWLLTPYQSENDLSLSNSKVGFNRRNSAATAVTQRALARLRDTWKCMQGGGWHPNNQLEMYWMIDTCCLLHNILIDIEEEEGAGKPRDEQESYNKHVRQFADEDAVRVRDALSQHLIMSGVAAEEERQEVAAAASGSGDESKDQEARRQQRADRGKEKVHDRWSSPLNEFGARETSRRPCRLIYLLPAA